MSWIHFLLYLNLYIFIENLLHTILSEVTYKCCGNRICIGPQFYFRYNVLKNNSNIILIFAISTISWQTAKIIRYLLWWSLCLRCGTKRPTQHNLRTKSERVINTKRPLGLFYSRLTASLSHIKKIIIEFFIVYNSSYYSIHMYIHSKYLHVFQDLYYLLF